MNLNLDTLIKQEFLAPEEELIHGIPDDELNISVKNEPILDEPFTSLTIKNEPIPEEVRPAEAITIKTENTLETLGKESETRENFIIYGLETSPAIHSQAPEQHKISNDPLLLAHKTSLNCHLSKNNFQKPNLNPESATKVPASTPPVLLNTQLRKRHKVILPVNPVDKRARYNIEGATVEVLEKKHVATNANTSKACRLLNTGSKKIINHLIKHKQEYCEVAKSSTNANSSGNQNTEKKFNSIVREKSLSPNPPVSQITANTQAMPVNLAPISLSPLTITLDPLNKPKQLADSPLIPELRVKCLCSLTDDNARDSSELRAFFKEMFEETRRLNKTQQRKIKMTLLKVICDAEESVEQGKCCNFF